MTLYISIDVETDGPIPGHNNLLSYGAVAFSSETYDRIGTSFYETVKPLPGCSSDPSTMEFWSKNKEAFEATQQNQQDPKESFDRFLQWLKDLMVLTSDKPLMIGYPATFDWMWVHWYLIRFTGENPMGFSGLCLQSYAAGRLDVTFNKAVMRNYPKSWVPVNGPISHIAVEDADRQGLVAMNMFRRQ